MLTYILLLILLWSILRFLNQLYRYTNKPTSQFSAPKAGKIERERKDRVREKDIEDAEFEILPKEADKQPE